MVLKQSKKELIYWLCQMSILSQVPGNFLTKYKVASFLKSRNYALFQQEEARVVTVPIPSRSSRSRNDYKARESKTMHIRSMRLNRKFRACFSETCFSRISYTLSFQTPTTNPLAPLAEAKTEGRRVWFQPMNKQDSEYIPSRR